MIGRDWPRPFALIRDADPSGVSGLGVVASGVIWPDGRAAMLWGPRPPGGQGLSVRQVTLWDDVAEVERIHGHGGATRLSCRDAAAAWPDLGIAVFGLVAHRGVRASITHWGVQFDNGVAVTWRNNVFLPVRIEQWPQGGASSAFAELQDLDADEARIEWVPSDALRIDSSTRPPDGRRWLRGAGYAPAPAARPGDRGRSPR